MNPLAALFAPLLLLVPGATAVTAVRGGDGGVDGGASGNLVPPPPDVVDQADVGDAPGWTIVAHSFRAPMQEQVRIEQRMTIRISPRCGYCPALPWRAMER